MLAGVLSEFLQVLDVAVQGTLLSVSGSVSIVWQEPSQRHVVLDVSVDCRACRELVVVLLAIERFLDSGLVAGTLLIRLSILEHHGSALV